MNNSNKNKSKIKLNNKIKQNINRKINNKIKKLKRNIRGANRRRNNNRIPAANTRTMNRDFRILYQDGNTVKVTGRDLVYKIPSDITDQEGTGIITVIPANPCYWLGTRIAALAQGYQNYRPLNMKFTYIPQCAVTQQGNVIAGTLWNQAPSNDNIQQSLRTSNGGQMSQCYKGFTSIVRLKSNLQYNLYKTAGQFDQESNPFLYIAMAVGCKQGEDHIIPGYFYVTWSFLLKNPIGNTNVYNNSGITTYDQIRDNTVYENKTIVFLTPDDEELQMGSILQLEKDTSGELQAYYNGTYYEMADDDIVWYFANSTIAAQNAYNNKKLKFRYTSTAEIEESQEGTKIDAQIYLRTNDNSDPQWYYGRVFTRQHEVTLFEKSTVYYIEDLDYAYAQHWLRSTFTGFITALLKDGDQVYGFEIAAQKYLVEFEQIGQEENARNKNKLRNKSVKPKELPQVQVKDKAIIKLQQQPQIVIPEAVKFTNKQKEKSKKIKQQLKYPEDEYDQFSASELFA
jgi:hypothetical protein